MEGLGGTIRVSMSLLCMDPWKFGRVGVMYGRLLRLKVLGL